MEDLALVEGIIGLTGGCYRFQRRRSARINADSVKASTVHSNLPSFKVLEPIHDSLHRSGIEILSLIETDAEMAKKRIPDILATRDKLER